MDIHIIINLSNSLRNYRYILLLYKTQVYNIKLKAVPQFFFFGLDHLFRIKIQFGFYNAFLAGIRIL